MKPLHIAMALGIALIWGFTFVTAKVGVAHFPPIFFTFLRFGTVAVLMLTGYFLWPVWVRSHAKSKKERKQMAQRFAGEVLRLSMHGVLRADGHAILKAYLKSNLSLS